MHDRTSDGPSMSRTLLTGMSGTGNPASSVNCESAASRPSTWTSRAWSFHNAEGHQLWCEDRLRAAIDAHAVGHLFVSGCAENQVTFYPEFSQIILLRAPADVIQERLATRTDNCYGKRPEELAEVLCHLERSNPMLRRSATHEIVTTMPLDRAVAAVLSFVYPAV
jgi:hypothetical protein